MIWISLLVIISVLLTGAVIFVAYSAQDPAWRTPHLKSNWARRSFRLTEVLFGILPLAMIFATRRTRTLAQRIARRNGDAQEQGTPHPDGDGVDATARARPPGGPTFTVENGVPNFTNEWWPRTRLQAVFLAGARLAFGFMLTFYIVVTALSAWSLQSGDSAKHVIGKLDAKGALWETQLHRWFESDNKYAYVATEDDKLVKAERERFLKALMPDFKKTLLEEDQLGLLGAATALSLPRTDLAISREALSKLSWDSPRTWLDWGAWKNAIPWLRQEDPARSGPCKTGLDRFSVQWVSLAIGERPIMGANESHDSCTAWLAARLAAGDGNEATDHQSEDPARRKSCQYAKYIKAVRSGVRTSFVFDPRRDALGLLGGAIEADSAQQTLNRLIANLSEHGDPHVSQCTYKVRSELDESKGPVVVAQLASMRDMLAGYYRAKALVWGPLQWLLIAFFFAACVALGKRRAFCNADKNGMKDFVKSRIAQYAEAIRQASSDKVPLPNPELLERSIKKSINEELDEDASYPLDLTIYVLPTVGFVGTVIGIAAALGGAGDVVDAAAQGIGAQKAAIAGVTGLLGIAFDTTLLALAAAAFVMFALRYRKSRERLIVTNAKMAPIVSDDVKRK